MKSDDAYEVIEKRRGREKALMPETPLNSRFAGETMLKLII